MPDKKEQVAIETVKETYSFDISIASDENAILPFHFDMDGILLRQANGQPVLRTEIKGRMTYVFMVPDGMDGAFRFEDAVEIIGSKPLFTVKKGDQEVDVLLLTREEANQLFILRDGSLVLTGAALLEDADGRAAPIPEPDETLSAVRSLPDKYKAPIYLFYYEGLSTAEISRLLSRRESTVRSDLRRGRLLLRQMLERST